MPGFYTQLVTLYSLQSTLSTLTVTTPPLLRAVGGHTALHCRSIKVASYEEGVRSDPHNMLYLDLLLVLAAGCNLQQFLLPL